MEVWKKAWPVNQKLSEPLTKLVVIAKAVHGSLFPSDVVFSGKLQ